MLVDSALLFVSCVVKEEYLLQKDINKNIRKSSEERAPGVGELLCWRALGVLKSLRLVEEALACKEPLACWKASGVLKSLRRVKEPHA